jgi:cytochrome P450
VAVTYPPDFLRSKWSLRRQVLSDPLAFLESLALTHGDVIPFSLAGRPAFLLTHPEAIESVLVTHQHKFVKAYGLQRATRLLGHGLLTAEGERHRRQRGVVQPAFHRQRLEGYAKTMVREAERMRDRWRNGDIVDLSAEAGALTLSIVGRALFGAGVDSFAAEVREAVRVASDSMDPLVSLLAPMRRVRPQRAKLLAVIDDLIARHRQHRSAESGDDSLIAALLDAGEAGPDVITDQLRDDALTILLAGHDTIANALIWTWIELAGRPDIEARLEMELDTVLGARSATAADVPALGFTRRVLAESLRLRPPAWVIARTAAVDHEVGGVRIPAGAIVLISQYLIHRDERFFPNPLDFDPDRWLDERQEGRPRMAFIPFGAGPRACIGEGFAWMEGVLLLATFAQRWRLRLREGEEPIRARPTITLRPPQLSMIVEARASRPY